jgi:hypothetical protein
VVDVSDCAHVDVRFASVEFFFGHVYRSSSLSKKVRPLSNQSGADVQDRTGDLVLTKDALCQLSYIGPPSLTLAALAASARQALLCSVTSSFTACQT